MSELEAAPSEAELRCMAAFITRIFDAHEAGTLGLFVGYQPGLDAQAVVITLPGRGEAGEIEPAAALQMANAAEEAAETLPGQPVFGRKLAMLGLAARLRTAACHAKQLSVFLQGGH